MGWEEPLEEGMAALSSILAWRIPWTEEHGRLWPIGSQRVGYDWSDWTELNWSDLACAKMVCSSPCEVQISMNSLIFPLQWQQLPMLSMHLGEVLFLFLFLFFLCQVLVAAWRSSSLTRDWKCSPCIGNVASSSPDKKGSSQKRYSYQVLLQIGA